MLPSELRNSNRKSPECSNTGEAQENDLETNFMNMIEVLKNEINKPLKEIKKKNNEKIQRKLVSPL